MICSCHVCGLQICSKEAASERGKRRLMDEWTLERRGGCAHGGYATNPPWEMIGFDRWREHVARPPDRRTCQVRAVAGARGIFSLIFSSLSLCVFLLFVFFLFFFPLWRRRRRRLLRRRPGRPQIWLGFKWAHFISAAQHERDCGLYTMLGSNGIFTNVQPICIGLERDRRRGEEKIGEEEFKYLIKICHLHVGLIYFYFFFFLTSMPRQPNQPSILLWDLI